MIVAVIARVESDPGTFLDSLLAFWRPLGAIK